MRRAVAGGTVDFTKDQPSAIEAPTDWGQYRLTVEDDGDNPAATSVEFYAGWYRAVSSSDTPDTLQVALDKPAYRIGDTAKLRLDPRFPGIALISVIDDRLIAMQAVEVPEGGTTVDLPVTDKWGPGAYVTATLYRPMDIAAKRMPARALGLTWAKVDPGDRDLKVALDLPEEMRPRGPMTIPVAISNLKPGEEAYVTVAAVDVGILNLTSFKAPAPDDWYFGQRKLGMEIRDIYGLLIDRTQGVPGVVRSGGDGGMTRLKAPPPTQKLLAFYSGILKVDDSGKASVTFDVPDFNGTVRVMAMAWSKDGVGHASQDVFVRDPVVVTASIPRFLARGDSSRLLVEINNVSGAAGDYKLSIATGEGIDFPADDAERTVTLAEKQRVSYVIPLDAKAIGDFDVSVDLKAPTGEDWPTNLTLGVRPAGSPVTHRDVISVAAGGTLTVDDALTSAFVPGTASVAVSLGGAGPLDVAGILAALDRYPYGCVEQLTSRAMPLVYLDEVAASVGIAADTEIRNRVQKAIRGVLADQAASGAFGLWGPYDAGGDLWLDSYVTDFLTRAAEKGYDVPDVARTIALDNLANGVAYANDFEKGGEDIAYALYVLARAGRAAIGDLRYYTDSKLDAFATPLAKAQLGAAMALYGDRVRAGRAFASAMADLDREDANKGWRNDYGTALRDGAAVLTLAAETEIGSVDLHSLALRIAAEERNKRYTSTQEDSWMLLAAAALIKDSAKTDFSIDGEHYRRAALPPLHRRGPGGQAGGDRQSRRRAAGGGRVGDRRAADAGARRRQRLHHRAQRLHARGPAGRHRHRRPERPLRRGAHRHRRARGRRPPAGRRSDPGRLRDREPGHLGIGQHDQPRLAQGRQGRPHRGADRPLRRRHRPQGRRSDAIYGRLFGARRVAGHLRLSGGDGGGHVSSRVQRPHRRRHGRGGRPDAVSGEERGTPNGRDANHGHLLPPCGGEGFAWRPRSGP